MLDILQGKGEEVASYLDGRSIILVGMMGAGKTTVGEILSKALDYTFVDRYCSDEYVEQVCGDVSVAEIFQQRGENFFRDNESVALRKLCCMPQTVVATGGGAVDRPINWEYMKQGITVFLNVPVHVLASRIAAEGTSSRPLLNFDSGDPYTTAYMRLFRLSKKRLEAYSNAQITVSLLNIANDMGLKDISDITSTAVAIEILAQMKKYLSGN